MLSYDLLLLVTKFLKVPIVKMLYNALPEYQEYLEKPLLEKTIQESQYPYILYLHLNNPMLFTLNLSQRHLYNAFIKCIIKGDYVGAKLLLSHGFVPSIHIVEYSVRKKVYKIIECILDTYHHLYDLDKLLSLAVSCKKLSTIRLLLHYGANVNSKDVLRYTPIQYASFHYPIVKLLLEYGANSKDMLYRCVWTLNNNYMYNNTQSIRRCIKLLLSHDADQNYMDGVRSAFMLACDYGNIELIKLFLKHGAKVNLQNTCGETSLIYGINSKSSEMVNLLLSQGARKDIQTKKW